jgi:hypothetical protein
MSRERYDHLQRLKREAAVELKLPVECERVAIRAMLRMHLVSLQELQVAGKPVSTDDLLRTAQKIVDLSPPPPTPPIRLDIVRDVVDICPQCHWSRPAAEKREPPPPSPPVPRNDPQSPAIERKPPAV